MKKSRIHITVIGAILILCMCISCHEIKPAGTIFSSDVKLTYDVKQAYVGNKLFNEMVNECISQTADFIKRKNIGGNILFGGISVLPNLEIKNALKRSLVDFMSDINIIDRFYDRFKQSGKYIRFQDISYSRNIEEAFLAEMEDVANYNLFFSNAFKIPLNMELSSFRYQHIKMGSSLEIENKIHYILYGYFYYSEMDAKFSPNSLYMVLKVSKLTTNPRNGVIFPKVENVSIIKKKLLQTGLNSLPRNDDKKNYWSIEKKSLMNDTHLGCHIEHKDITAFEQSDASGMFSDLNKIWGIIPRSSFYEPLTTALLMDLAQQKLLKASVPLVDTTLIRKHLYRESNRKIILNKANIEKVLPNIIEFSAISNIESAIEKYYFKTAYLIKCPYDEENENFLIKGILSKNIIWDNNSTHIDNLSTSISSTLDKFNVFHSDFDGKFVTNVFIVNSRLWPRNQIESEIIRSVKYKTLKLLLHSNPDVVCPYFEIGTAIPKHLLISVNLRERLNDWSSEIMIPNNKGNLFLEVDFEIGYKMKIMEEITIPEQHYSDVIKVEKPCIAKNYITEGFSQEMESLRAVTQRYYTELSRERSLKNAEDLYAKAMKNAEELKRLYIKLVENYDGVLEKSAIYRWGRLCEKDLERIQRDQTVQLLSNLRKAEVESIFLYDHGWYSKANGYISKAKTISNAMNNMDYLERVERVRRQIESLNIWVKFQKICAKADKARDEKNWETARKNYEIARNLLKKIKHDLTVQNSKRFEERNKLLASIDVLLKLDERLNLADIYEKKRAYSAAYKEYERAEQIYQKRGNLDIQKSYYQKIIGGKNRTKDLF